MGFDKKGLTFQRRQTVGPKIISIRHYGWKIERKYAVWHSKNSLSLM